jgi:hypothetical protein
MNEPAAGNSLIKASELVDFEYCRRAWWYRHVQKLEPTHHRRLARGQAAHGQHHQQVQSAGLWRRVGLVFLAAGLLLVAGALLGLV